MDFKEFTDNRIQFLKDLGIECQISNFITLNMGEFAKFVMGNVFTESELETVIKDLEQCDIELTMFKKYNRNYNCYTSNYPFIKCYMTIDKDIFELAPKNVTLNILKGLKSMVISKLKLILKNWCKFHDTNFKL